MKAERGNLMRKSVWITAALLVLAFAASAFALTPGQTYTVKFGIINSSGVLTPAAYSTAAVANSNGVIDFSLAGLPNDTTCNFMGVAVFNATSSTTPEREAIVPCPIANTAMPLGVSGMTNTQAQALLSAFHSAGTDDPVLAVFGLAMLRSTNINSSELDTLATIAESGIAGSGGFDDHLTTKLTHWLTNNGDTNASADAATDLGIYRKNIVASLANATNGYSKLVHDSVGVSNSTSAQDLGKAAARILGYLVTSTRNPNDSQIHAGWIMEAIDQMGSIVQPAIIANAMSGGISQQTAMAVQSSIGTGIQELEERVAIQQYANAMTTLGGGIYATRFTTAATALQNAADSAMETFNETAFANGMAANPTAMQSAATAMENAVSTDFTAFQNAISGSDTDISTMIAGICNALGDPTMFDPHTQNNQPCTTALPDMNTANHMFQYFGPNGTQENWPLNMIILTNWLSGVLNGHGSLTYTRDTLSIPTDMEGMLGFCANATGPLPMGNPQTECGLVNGTWINGARSCYGSNPLSGEQGYPSSNSTCQNLPSPYWIEMAVQQDIWIEQDNMSGAMQACQQQGNPTPSQMEQSQTCMMNGQATFNTNMSSIGQNIAGTTATGVNITGTQQKAFMELMTPPSMGGGGPGGP